MDRHSMVFLMPHTMTSHSQTPRVSTEGSRIVRPSRAQCVEEAAEAFARCIDRLNARTASPVGKAVRSAAEGLLAGTPAARGSERNRAAVRKVPA